MVYIAYFSPTGGSKKVALALGRGVGQPMQEVDLCDASTVAPQLTGEDWVIFAGPVFGGRIPALMAQRMAPWQGNGARAVLVALQAASRHSSTPRPHTRPARRPEQTRPAWVGQARPSIRAGTSALEAAQGRNQAQRQRNMSFSVLRG